MTALTSNVSAATTVGKAILYGTMGTYSQLDEVEAIKNSSTVANIDGNAQYEATWNITGTGTSSIDFLALQIMGADSTSDTLMNFTSEQYPSLDVVVNAVYIDDVKVDSYTTGPNSTDKKYFKNNLGMTRVYLASTLDTPMKCEDLPTLTSVKRQVKVVFTVSGLSGDGTSNVTGGAAVTTTTSDPFAGLIANTQTTTTVVTNDPNAGFFNNQTTAVASTTTGDGGVAAVAIAGLAVTATAAVLSKVKFGKKKK
jgi:hypothetical protein